MSVKIQKSSSSEIFDNYTSVMNKYLIKKASWATQILDELVEVGKPFFGGSLANKTKLLELLSQSGKSIDDFILELGKQGKNVDEISQLTGKTSEAVKKILTTTVSPAVPNAAKSVAPVASEVASEVGNTIADVAQTGTAASKITQQVAEVVNALEAASKAVKAEGKGIIEVAQEAKNLEGKSLDEVIGLYEQLKRSRSAMKGQITKMRSELEKAKQLSTSMTEELTKKDELIRAAEKLYQNSEQEALSLAQKVEQMGGKLDEAGNIIKGLQGELGAVKNELDVNQQALNLANQTVKDLSEKGIQLTAENQKLLADSLKASEMAGYYKSLYEAAQVSGKAETASGKIALEASNQAEKQAVKSSSTITKSSPAAEPVVEQAKRVAKNNGAKKAAKAIEAEEDSLVDTTKATTNGIKPKEVPVKEGLIQKLILKNSPYLIEGGLGLMGSGLFSLLKFTAIAGALGGGAYLAWKYFFQKDPQGAVKIKAVMQSQETTVSKLRSLKFKPNSIGQQKTTLLIQSIITSLRTISGLSNVDNLTEGNYNQILNDLDSVDLSIDDYLNSKDLIANDLESPEGFEEAIEELHTLKNNFIELKKSVLEATQSSENIKNETSLNPTQRGINQPIGKTVDVSENTPPLSQHIPQMVKVFGTDIDIGKDNSPGFRSSANRIIEKVINTPEGKAFLDPDNLWGGWLTKTTQQDENGKVVQDKATDYLRALKFLYLNKIFNLQDLRKFIKDNLPKDGRKRLSGWNTAIKHYMSGINNQANQKNNDFFTQKFSKSANYSTSSVISNGIKLMNKKADQISKEYFQEAITDLEDQYAKSYYTGLKGMYDQKPDRTEADYKSMYQVHQESGADLIGESHPETITIADAMGNGGVVENQIEQHRHNVDVAKSMPSGNFRGKHAWVLKNLVKLANQADDQGLKEASDLIDAAINELTSVK